MKPLEKKGYPRFLKKKHTHVYIYMGMGQNPRHLVNIKIAGKWMFIPLKMYL
jgi:hypothetical protein